MEILRQPRPSAWGWATGTSTPPSMTAPASPTPRSTTTNKAPPPPGSGPGHAWFAAPGHHRRGGPHRQRTLLPVTLWAAAPRRHRRDPQRTRPYRPQTNGKVERFHRILLEEWAYIRPWTSEPNAPTRYDGFIHFYNHHRSTRGTRLAHPRPAHPHWDNLPGSHDESHEVPARAA